MGLFWKDQHCYSITKQYPRNENQKNSLNIARTSSSGSFHREQIVRKVDGALVRMIGLASHRVKGVAAVKKIYFWKKLRELLARITESDRRLLLAMARKMARRSMHQANQPRARPV